MCAWVGMAGFFVFARPANCVCVCVCEIEFACVHVHVHVCVCVCVCVFVCVRACVSVRMTRLIESVAMRNESLVCC